MSPYQKGRLFIFWTLFVFFSFPFWVQLLTHVLGWEIGLIVGGLLWLGHGIASLTLVTCPKCGASVFCTGKGFFEFCRPWPFRNCRNCGADLTVRLDGRAN